MVEWAPSRRFLEHLVHPRGEIRQVKPEFFRDSDHSRVGFFAAAGPAIARGSLGTISPTDLAPLFLSLMGERFPLPSPRASSSSDLVEHR